jgi:hypothetical protein
MTIAVCGPEGRGFESLAQLPKGLLPLSTRQVVTDDRPHPSRIRHKIECALIIPMIIQTILLYPLRAVWTDTAPNVSRQDPTRTGQSDAEHQARNRKVEGSNPSSGSNTAGQRTSCLWRVRPAIRSDRSWSVLVVSTG